MTPPVRGAWHGLLDASRPERARLRAMLGRAIDDLARITAHGAVALGTCNVTPSAALLQTTRERGD